MSLICSLGHLGEATPPTTPTTLHYRGVSFDVVNPHASLLLGYSDIETPAEIDGLLDDYFNRSTQSIAMPYDDHTGEKSASQHSLQTSSSNGRQRILYGDADSARRNIMGIPTQSSQQTVIHRPLDEDPVPQSSLQRPAVSRTSSDEEILRIRGRYTNMAFEHDVPERERRTYEGPFADFEGDRAVSPLDESKYLRANTR
jgi:hypothetical protein